MILHLVRHGQTAHNRDGLGLGRLDVPLTEVGLLQAESVGTRLGARPIRVVYTSPLQRARAVAEAIAASCGAQIDVRDALLELDVGETEGLRFDEMRVRYPDFLREWAGENCTSARMPGGESLDDVNTRLGPFIEEVLAGDDEEVAIVSHNFVVKLQVCRLLSLPPSAFRSFAIDVASVSTFSVRSGRASLLTLNDRCHITG